MLLMVRTEPAIEGTAVFGVALQRERAVAGLDVVLAELPIGGIGRDQRRLRAVLRAALLVPDFVVAYLDLRRHQPQTGLAQRGGLAPKNIVTRSTQRRGHRGHLVLARLQS